jgi:hypothetical protein
MATHLQWMGSVWVGGAAKSAHLLVQSNEGIVLAAWDVQTLLEFSKGGNKSLEGNRNVQQDMMLDKFREESAIRTHDKVTALP